MAFFFSSFSDLKTGHIIKKDKTQLFKIHFYQKVHSNKDRYAYTDMESSFSALQFVCLDANLHAANLLCL